MAELNLECLAPGQGTLRHGVPNKREPGASIMGPLNDLVAERLPRVELAEVLIEVDSWTGFTQFFRHAGGARSRNPDLVRHGLRGDPGPGLQLRPHDEGRHRRFDLPPARRDHGLVPARGDAQSGLLGLSWTSSTSCLLPRPGAVEPSPPPMASDSPFEARRRTRPRSRNISASEGASLSTPGPRTSTRSTGRRSSRLRFVTRPMSSTRSSITRPIFRSSSTPRTPLATPRSSSPCFIFWGCSSPPASGTWALSAGIVSMLLRAERRDRGSAEGIGSEQDPTRQLGRTPPGGRLTQVGLGDRLAPDFEAPGWRKRERLVPSPSRSRAPRQDPVHPKVD